MKHAKLMLFVLTTLGTTIPTSQSRDFPGSTHFLIELFRHGARNPMHHHKYPYGIPALREGLHDLTPTGIRNHYNLGSLLRNKFQSLYPQGKNKVYIAVSSTERTVASAISNYFGRQNYPNQKKASTQSINPNLYYPPSVPVSSGKPYRDSLDGFTQVPFFPYDILGVNDNFMFWSSKLCPRLKTRYSGNYQQMLAFLSGKLDATVSVFSKEGYDIKTSFSNKHLLVEKLFEFLDWYISRMFSDPDFEWTYETKLHSEVVHVIKQTAKARDNQLNRLLNHHLYRDWISKIDAFLTQPSKALVGSLYSAHDSNISEVLSDLFGLNDLECILDLYGKYVASSQVSGREDYVAIIQRLREFDCFHLIPFASSLSIEVYTVKVLGYTMVFN